MVMEMNRVIAPGAVLPDVFRCYADVILARIKHCEGRKPPSMAGLTMVK